MTTRADCLAGSCPCSRPERPPEGHECPPDPRTIDEREADTYAPHLDEYRDARELNRLEGVPVAVR